MDITLSCYSCKCRTELKGYNLSRITFVCATLGCGRINHITEAIARDYGRKVGDNVGIVADALERSCGKGKGDMREVIKFAEERVSKLVNPEPESDWLSPLLRNIPTMVPYATIPEVDAEYM